MACADTEPPVTGRPEHFSGAVGSFNMEARAQPTEVFAEEPLTLTVRITGTAKATEDRWRPKLRESGRLKDDFQVEALPKLDKKPDAGTWEFAYRLRPRSTRVKKVPRLEFVYYQPEVGYQRSYSQAIPITVKPRPAVTRIKDFSDAGGRIDRKYPLVTGEAVLAHEEAPDLPGPWFLAFLFAAPPFLCWAWYDAWRRLYPDAARVAGRRRSRAARRALKSLRGIGKGRPGDEAGARAAGVAAEYLRQRLDLASAEPTPGEALACLEQSGISTRLAGEFAAFFRGCDAARFAPEPFSARPDLAAEASRLVRALEAELCLSRPS
jgi:hypothetical protein